MPHGNHGNVVADCHALRENTTVDNSAMKSGKNTAIDFDYRPLIITCFSCCVEGNGSQNHEQEQGLYSQYSAANFFSVVHFFSSTRKRFC